MKLCLVRTDIRHSWTRSRGRNISYSEMRSNRVTKCRNDSRNSPTARTDVWLPLCQFSRNSQLGNFLYRTLPPI